MTIVWFSENAEIELNALSTTDKTAVSEAVSALEDDNFRQQNQVDYCIVKKDYKIWALLVGYIWLAFCEKVSGLEVVHLSLLSRFRRRESK